MAHLIDLTLDECIALLETRRAGRIAIQTPGGLRIFPVNYATAGDSIVFRTIAYGEIANNAHGAEVAFQIDELDEDLKRGWSVLAVGPVERVTDPDEVAAIRREGDAEPWAEGQRNLYFRLNWTDVTGRQVGMPSRPSLIPAGRTGSDSSTPDPSTPDPGTPVPGTPVSST